MKRILLLSILLFSLLHAIVCISADGSSIPLDRQYHYYYHNGTNDYNFYGSNRWAVRYKFRDAYPGLADVNFEVQGARLWFPNVADSVLVELYSDSYSQPGSRILSKRVPITDNLVDVWFDESTIQDTIWLVVSYSTNMNNRFVSASAGDGSSSYFMNQVGEQQYLASLASAGFNCDLLFGVLGEFVLSGPDIELVDFSLEGELFPSGRVYPSFRLYNHGDETLENSSLRIYLNKPGAAQYDTLYIAVGEAIEGRSEFDFTAQDFIDLPEEPTQIRLDVQFSANIAENDTLLANNSKSKTFNLFTEAMPAKLVENFIQEEHQASAIFMQEQYLQEDSHVLDYYPVLADSLANLGALNRFNWYGFNSLPCTVGNGLERILGFTAGYETDFAAMMESLQEQRTFISNSSCRLDTIPDSENVMLTLSFNNENTNLYTGMSQSIVTNSNVFTALFAQDIAESSSRYNLLRWISFADTINTPATQGSIIEKSYTISASGLFDDAGDLRYRIYYWLQGKNGGKIHYAAYEDFNPESLTPNQDALLPSIVARAYPNPLRGNSGLKIVLADAVPAKAYIYNLKGQRIVKVDEFRRDATIPRELFPASGIYFLRLIQDGKAPRNMKISIIK
jgi:hypothetical protein